MPRNQRMIAAPVAPKMLSAEEIAWVKEQALGWPKIPKNTPINAKEKLSQSVVQMMDGKNPHYLALQKELASGSFGTLKPAQDIDTGATIAVKIAQPKDADEIRDVETERKVLKLIGRFRGQMERKNKNGIVKHYTAMEFYEGNSLANTSLRDCDYSQRRRYALTLLKELQWLHDLHVIHRDINPNNIFITADKQAKIIDFGLSLITERDRSVRCVKIGTAKFIPPEIEDGNVNIYSFVTDIWSMGQSLKLGLFKRQAMSADERADFKIMSAMLDRMTAKNPEDRPSLQECVAILQQPMLVGVVEEKEPSGKILIANFERKRKQPSPSAKAARAELLLIAEKNPPRAAKHQRNYKE
jgi:serine/threonine protein kinase